MAACLESLSLANVSNALRSVASLVLEGREDDKDGEFSAKVQFLHFLHSCAMEAAHWAYPFAGMNTPCVQLACLRSASSALSLPCSWKFSMKTTENHEVQIPTGGPNERGDCT